LDDLEKLTELVGKLKNNRDKVPLETLKTKYKVPYGKLITDIRDEANKTLLPIAFRLPWYLENARLREHQQQRLIAIFKEEYEKGGYSKRIGKALFCNFSVGEAVAAAQEMGGVFLEKLEAVEFFHEGTGIFITDERGVKDGTTPKVYNEFVGKFWDESTQGWRDPEPGEAEEPHGFWDRRFCKLINDGMTSKKKEAV
jgi:hypothetical protein